MNQHRGPRLIDSFDKSVTTALFVVVSEQAPLRTRFIEREGNILSGKLGFFDFDFGVGGGQSKRAAWGITWIIIATHYFYLRSGLRMTNLGRISDAKLFCPVSGLNATTGRIVSILKILKSCLTKRKKAGRSSVKGDEVNA